ncbi:MAG TPA: hypothetical protein VN157_14615 [Caulobacter sp.]|nr:hypothetical protein [Caulobacter sp.]
MIGAVLALALQADTDPSCIMTPDKVAPALKFGAYPARPWRGPVAKARQDTRFARLFRTVLKAGAARGPNFAGRFTIVEFGCGMSCVYWAVVDAATGRVFDPPAAPLSILHASGRGLEYRRDSRLLVLSGGPREGQRPDGVYSYVWTGKAFREVGFIPRAMACEASAEL